MNIIYFLLPAALLLALIFVGLYLWAARKGQFDDLDTPSRRILLDDADMTKRDNKLGNDVNGA